jgi:hypothetical protein
MDFKVKFEIRNGFWKTALCLFLLNAPQQIFASYERGSHGPHKPLDIEVGSEEKIAQNLNFQMQASSLKQFYMEKVWTAFPSDLQNLLLPYRLTLFLTSYCPSDGLFMDPEVMSGLSDSDSPGPGLWLCMKPDLFWGPDAYTLLAHEVFHAVHFLVHPNEEAWIREGLAQWFEYRVTRNFNGSNVRAALEHPETSLIAPYIPGKTSRNQYGHNLLYIYYLWSHCGGEPLIWDIARAHVEIDASTPMYGVMNVDRLLKRRKAMLEDLPSECDSFENSAISFEIARIHNKTSHDGSKNNNPHYLLATALQVVEPRKELPKEVDGIEFYHVGAFTPILLSGEAKTTSLSFEKFHIVWLEKYFPYAVKMSRPEHFIATRWDVLLIKK